MTTKLTSQFFSCKEESDVPIKGETTGIIPSWLSGTLLRNGPGLFEIGDTQYNHAFDGLALIHRFSVDKGEATYSNKFLRSDRYLKNIEANRIVLAEFGTEAYPDPCKTIWQRFMSTFQVKTGLTTDNCNVTVCPYGDKIYVATETNFIHEIDPETLNNVGKQNLQSYLAVNHATAHTHVEPDGTVYNMGNSYVSGPHYNIIKFPPPKENENKETLSPFQQASIVAKIPARWKMNPGYYHSFSITDNYVIFIEQPLCVSVRKIFWGSFLKKPLGESLSFYPNEKARFYVVKKDTGANVEIVYESSVPFCFFHTINAYEDKDHIVLDISCYSNSDVIQQLYLKRNIPDDQFILPVTWRFVLPLTLDKTNEEQMKLSYIKCSSKLIKNVVVCQPEIFSSAICELVRINYGRNGKKYRYFYGLGNRELHKGDWESKNVSTWKDEDYYPSEPIFVAKPDAEDEDDGILLASLQKASDPNTVCLLIMDAKSFTEISRTTFVTKSAVPFTFHGLFTKTGDKIHSY